MLMIKLGFIQVYLLSFQSIFAEVIASVKLIPLLLSVWFIALRWLSFGILSVTCLKAFTLAGSYGPFLPLKPAADAF